MGAKSITNLTVSLSSVFTLDSVALQPMKEVKESVVTWEGRLLIVGYLKQMHLISLQATDEILGICVQNQPILSQRTRLLQSYGT